MKNITKAVISAAGYGTRFLPATKSVPKEMLLLLDQPILEYVTEECVQAGITDIIIVTRYGSDAIVNYLDSSKELELFLEQNNKVEYLKIVKHAYKKANFVFVRQSADLPYGSATPLWASRNLIDPNESFAYLFGDDVFVGKTPAIKEIIDEHVESISADKNIIGVIGANRVAPKELKKWGMIQFEDKNGRKILKNVIEKPKHEIDEPQLVRTGRFVYSADIFKYFTLDIVKDNPRHEFELTDIENLAKKDRTILVKETSADWYPVGDPENHLISTVKLALKRPDYSKIIKQAIRK